MTPKQSLLRRCLAVLSAALLAGVLVTIGDPVGATGPFLSVPQEHMAKEATETIRSPSKLS